jgi:hypothetical protein
VVGTNPVLPSWSGALGKRLAATTCASVAASACVSGSAEFADGSFDAVGKLYVVLRNSLGHVGPEGEMHPAPADVHIWMVVHLFRDLGDLVHQADGGGKVRRDGGPAQRLLVTRPPGKIVELTLDLVSVENPRWHRRKGSHLDYFAGRLRA